MKYKLLFALICCMGVRPAFAQITTQGTDFYVAFGRNSNSWVGTWVYQVRIVASTQAADIKLTFNSDGTVVDNIHINAGEVFTYNLDAAQRTKVYASATGASYKSLRIESTVPVSVYALNQALAGADATNVFPVHTLGTDYYHFSYKPYYNNVPDAYLAIAIQDGTELYEEGTLKATLSAGQVYACYCYPNTDFTGTHITSNYPIAYFVSNETIALPIGVNFGEYIFQQMVPVSSWGTTFLVPVTHRGLERVRIVASQDGTRITQTGGVKKTDGGGYAQNPSNENDFTLDAGQFVELEISLAQGGCYIVADKPVGVASYLTGALYSALTVSKGDPALAWIPPIEQTVNSAAIAPFFVTPASATVMDEHHALIVTPTDTRDETTLAIGNNSPGPLSGGSWTEGNGEGSAYSFYSLPLTNATSSYFFANSNGLFVLGYGIGVQVAQNRGEAYYYVAGSSARNLSMALYVNDVHYQDMDGVHTFCGSRRQTLSFRAVLQYAQSTPGYLEWYINGGKETSATDQLQWDKTFDSGVYQIEMKALDLEDQIQTISVTIAVSTCVLPVNPHLMIRYR